MMMMNAACRRPYTLTRAFGTETEPVTSRDLTCQRPPTREALSPGGGRRCDRQLIKGLRRAKFFLGAEGMRVDALATPNVPKRIWPVGGDEGAARQVSIHSTPAVIQPSQAATI